MYWRFEICCMKLLRWSRDPEILRRIVLPPLMILFPLFSWARDSQGQLKDEWAYWRLVKSNQSWIEEFVIPIIAYHSRVSCMIDKIRHAQWVVESKPISRQWQVSLRRGCGCRILKVHSRTPYTLLPLKVATTPHWTDKAWQIVMLNAVACRKTPSTQDPWIVNHCLI